MNCDIIGEQYIVAVGSVYLKVIGKVTSEATTWSKKCFWNKIDGSFKIQIFKGCVCVCLRVSHLLLMG